jgi:soluble lytic murein transglycosylase-like protein
MEQAIVNAAVAEAQLAAAQAAEDYIRQHGEDWYCGFAWVTVYEKGSTKLGRALLKSGFKKAYGGGLQMWNPSGHGTQSMSVKEAGAEAAARVLKERLGVTVYAGGRAD